MGEKLFEQVPELRALWHPTMNTDPKVQPGNLTRGSHKKVYWVCPEYGHYWLAAVKMVSRGNGCAVCRGYQVCIGFNDFESQAPDRAQYWHPTRNLEGPSEVTWKSGKKVWFLCENSHEFDATIANVSNGRWCPYCSGNKVIPGENDVFTVNPEIIPLWSKKNQVDPTTLRPGSNRKVWWDCAEGHTWEASVVSVTSGSRCGVCSGDVVVPGINDLFTLAPQVAELWNTHKNTVDPTTIGPGNRGIAWWTCAEGHEWPNNIRRVVQGQGCTVCSGRRADPSNNLTVTHPDIAAEWDAELNTYNASEVTKGHDAKVWWRCRKNLEHSWEAAVYSRTGVQASGCPLCTTQGSMGQNELTAFVEEEVPGMAVMTDARNIIGSQAHLDIYIPDLQIAIEYNGLYWHSDNPRRTTMSTAQKVETAKRAGIDLYVVWEDDWRDRQEITKDWIRGLLGTRKQRKVNARDCTVVSIDYKDAKEFLKKNHIQGPATGKYYLSLKSNDVPVAVAVFRDKADGTLSLERYATSDNVRGGFSKILSYVDRNIPYTQMETFADLTYSKGKLYERTGWTKNKVLDPDYSYYQHGQRRHKFNFRIKNFREEKNRQGNPRYKFEEGLTERELAELNSLYRVYDAGKIKYTRSKP